MNAVTTGCLVGLAGLALTACGASELGNWESEQALAEGDRVGKRSFDLELREACGTGELSATGTDRLLRWPYLQRTTDHSVRVMWTAKPGLRAAVRVTTPGGERVASLDAVRDDSAARAEFEQWYVDVSALEPDTVYCYQLVGDGAAWNAPTGFRTAPAADSAGPIQFAVIGDLGTQTTDQFMVRDQLSRVPHELVLVAGDLAYEDGTLSDHENNFFAVYRALLRSVPFFVVSGNHDYAADGAVFREVFALFENGGGEGRERWYSLDWGPIHVAALDTERIGPTQAAWLDADLAATDRPWRIVLMHRPAYSSGWHGSNSSVQEHFVPVFVKHGVQLVLAGHDHNYERTRAIDGVTYAVIGSSGRGTRSVGTSSYTAYSEEVAHFAHVTVEGDELRLNAIDATGKDFDTVVIER